MKIISIITLLFISSVYTYGASDISLVSFVFQRTVIRPNTEIPVVVRIWNAGVTDTEISLEITLSDNLTLIIGSSKSKAIMTNLAFTEVSWSVQVPASGNIAANLCVIVSPGDTLKALTSGSITDKFWEQQEFLLSAWSPPSNMQLSYDYYKTANFDFNLIVGSPYSDGLNIVKENGMKCFVQISETIPNYWAKLAGSNSIPPEITGDDISAMDPTLNAYKNEPSVAGYYIIDEPGASRFNNLAKIVSHIKENDPTKLAFINMLPSYAASEQMNTSTYEEYISRYLDEVKPEMLSYDHYHFYTGYDGTDYFSNLGIISNFGIKYKIPYTNIIQLIGTESEYSPSACFLNWRTPNTAEHRFLVYSSLAYGYTGIIWFHWQALCGLTEYPTAKKSEIYATVTQLNKEIKNIGTEMIKLKSVKVYHVKDIPRGTKELPSNEIVKSVVGSQSYIVGLFKDSIQSDYFMIMNKDYTCDSQATIKLSKELSKLEYFDANSSQWINLSNFTVTSSESEFSMTITAGNGILFRPVWVDSITSVTNKPTDSKRLLNYPNPFKLNTTIEYNLTENQEVELTIYNTLGNKVYSFGKTFRTKGTYTENFDASSFPAGIYFYTLKLKNSSISERMILSR